MSAVPVLLDKVGSVARITLNRPERRNALNDALVAELAGTLAEVEHAAWCRSVVLTGAGRAFCAGGDMDANVDEVPDAVGAAARHRLFLTMARRLMLLPKPTVAAVNGAAVGAGCSLALICDELVLAGDARLGLGFLRVGLPPDLLSVETLQRRAGWTVATDLLHSGRLVGAVEACELRLAHEVAEGDVVEAATRRAQALGELSPFAFAATKAMLREAWSPGQSLAELEALLVGISATTPEFRAATEQFRTPRQPPPASDGVS